MEMKEARQRERRRLMTLAAMIAAVIALRYRRTPPGYRQSLFWRTYEALAQWLDHAAGWHGLPTPLGLAVVVGIRTTLRKQNLFDTGAAPSTDPPPLPPPDARYLTSRTVDGSYNDLDHPAMGMAGTRFGRNVPIAYTYPEPEPRLLDPNPRTVSRELLTRSPFQPATSVNVLVAAWLQFMIRDWFSHGKSEQENPWEIALRDDDPFPERPFRILRTRRDPTRPPDATDLPPTYVNTETHWWDASQIYGSTQQFQTVVRAGQGGKLRIGPNGLLPIPTDPALNPTLVPGWWLGLAMMHTLFTLEHNAICDRLHAEYPTWSDEELYQRARLINAALLAKIHTVEWSPAVAHHPTIEAALGANWWGFQTEAVTKVFGRLTSDEVISGIPGSSTQHFDVPYSITEEFIAVYRMHPLVPDDYQLRAAADDRILRECTFREIAGPHAQEIVEQVSMTDLFYSFGTMHPGLVTLHNFPRFLQEFERPDGHFMDLAATDILRIRELGVPRYNQFRRLVHLLPVRSFEELTDNREWAEQIRRVYHDDIERVDLLIGMYAERRPEGFAFSDTALRILLLLASRRLNSDRFFTRDYTPQVYTQVGLDWINNTTLVDVLLRHYPQLRPMLRGVTNAFMPWAKAPGAGG